MFKIVSNKQNNYGQKSNTNCKIEEWHFTK